MDELAAGLVLENGQQTETDHQCASDITLRVPHVPSCGALQEQQGEEDDDLRNDASLVRNCVDSEGFETGHEKKHDYEAVVKAEGEVDKHRIGQVVCCVVHLKGSVAVGDCTSDEEHHNKRDNCIDSIMVTLGLGRDETGIDSVEQAKTGESPSNTMHHMGRSSVGKLVNDHSEE